jgi:putative transposase
MRGRHPAVAVVISDAERRILEGWVRERRGPRSRTERAALLLGAAADERNRVIGLAVGLGREAVRMWRQRWQGAAARRAEATAEDREAVLDAILADAPRPGAPARFSAEQVARIVAVACEKPDDKSQRPVSHWVPRELAAEVIARNIVPSISARHVGRFLDVGRGRSSAASQPLLADPTTGRP